MYKYAMTVEFDTESDCYIVTVPQLKGCMADGKTPQEAVANAQIVIEEWIETAKELGRNIPTPI